MHNLQIEQTPIHALRKQDRNARTHSKRQIRQIADSMKRFGFNNPILTDDDLQIIAGHGRLEAAKLLGMTAVPFIRLSHMTEAEKRAYVVADNQIALKAGWDREILAIELQGLIDIGFEVELTGFEPTEIDLILENWQEASIEANAEDEQSREVGNNPVTRTGDVWILGEHRLLCGDARSPEAYDKLMGPDRADLIFTDTLMRKVRIKDNESVREVPKFLVAAEVCLNNAIKGDLKSFAKIMELVDKYGLLEPAPIGQEPVTLIRRIIVDPKQPGETSE